MVSRTAGFLALIALGTGLVFAQGSTATIIGTVKDVSGAVLPAASITVKQLETGLTRTIEADTSGNYSIPSLPVGPYEVTAEKMGFRREVRRGIDLVVAQEAVVNIILQVGSLEQQVTVTEEAPLVNTTLALTQWPTLSGRNIPLDSDVPGVLPRFRHVVGELHAEKVVHVRAERLFDAQGHFRRQRCRAVQKVGKRGAAHFQNLRRLRYVEAEGFDDLGFDQVARMGRILHGHFSFS